MNSPSISFGKRRKLLGAMISLRSADSLVEVTTHEPSLIEELFVKCNKCHKSTSVESMSENLYVCPHCGHHLAVTSFQRFDQVMDAGSVTVMFEDVVGDDPLGFPGYPEKVERLQVTTGLREAAQVATGKICGCSSVVIVLDRRFMMGSMGTAVGERITRGVEFATEQGVPLVIFSASGGARMQEGIHSLMQMAKTAAAVQRHKDAGNLYISVCTHPTTGGVTASFASLGDIILAEPGALIGFAGPRVIEQTIGQTLPEGFQRAEYLLEHGFLDAIVARGEMREMLGRILNIHEKRGD